MALGAALAEESVHGNFRVMRFSAAIVGALLGTLAAAQTNESSPPAKSALPRIVLPSEPNGQPGAAKSTPAPKAPPAGATKSKKEEKMGKIEGVEIARSSKGWLGIQIVDATFRLAFYDEKKKPVAADMDRAALRWDPKYKVGEDRVVLTPSDDGKALVSARNIRPPYNFKLFITLLKDAKGNQPAATENYTIDFRQ
jgi:hypothetical protein